MSKFKIVEAVEIGGKQYQAGEEIEVDDSASQIKADEVASLAKSGHLVSAEGPYAPRPDDAPAPEEPAV